ncbi:glucosaminidase domain-containing protein [Candidatus Viridilinea mediisalina]|uniref:Mannosyl-glycoprotein endo-beta-N-acetylglucosamidase-like domain-containing protein n=1 Tax=Candidatus Viridilinea mediisalina TaxID=2024553 RepID=A0A2A6REF9_9CHLR|nr:glucosaminidase domain-containing protein [Candidatus Viridilinea mediisalina]PDW01443.1 hypothetical protein CJ255_19080 [Candidatus Viridilinea mediisalina]
MAIQASERRRWWYERGEPGALTLLAMAAISLPPLVLIGVLRMAQAGQVAVVLAWVAALLLLLRLPALLRGEGRRLGLLGLVLATGFTGAGLAAVPPAVDAQGGGLTFAASPRISQEHFSRILITGNSPAAPYGDELYAIIVSYGLDPAVALAFFQHESQYCTTGACVNNALLNWGMLRRHIRPERNAGSSGGFARYANWEDSVRDWCELMLGYIRRGMDTVEKAIPVYAPTSDGNVPSAYINAVRRQVAAWSGGNIPSGGAPREPALRAYSMPLDQALLSETFLAAAVEYRPTWAFHQYLLSESQAGRPLGVPVDGSRIINVNGQRFAVQVFALDTLYTPIAAQEAETNWGDVRRLSDLLRQSAPQTTPTRTVTPTPSSDEANSR